MIPDGCSLAVDDGVVCVVGEAGDVRTDHDETGVYGNDTQYLREFAVRLTATDTPDRGWDHLERRAGPSGVETVLIGGAPGDGRGDARRFVVTRSLTVGDDTVSVETTVQNYTAETRTVDVELAAESAFRHVFECPGFFSPRDPVEREVLALDHQDGVELSGTSPDGVTRRATVELTGATSATRNSDGDTAQATLSRRLSIPPGERETVTATTTLRPTRGHSELVPELDVTMDDRPGLFDAAASTLRALLLPEGVPAAGAPRFVAPFGRDSLLVGFQTLPFAPDLTRNVLNYLADQQATASAPDTLAEPGKIPHEGRCGDLPALGRSIRSPYYGTVDATPLFAALVAAYGEWAGEDTVTDELYDAAVAAVEWTLSTADEDGFLWYEPHDHDYGLTHQGWKDSADAIARPDGTAATPPIALAEVQGYAYRALDGVADLARERDDDEFAARLDERARQLQTAFDEQFWLPSEACYALALDADGVVDAVASNQGHALWSGIVPAARADDVIDRLLQPDMVTEAGLRTYAASHDAFDPLSYHRGSVWPHDTSLAAMGCARYGRDDAVKALVERGVQTLSTGGVDHPSRWGFPELLVGLDATDADAGRARHPDSCEPAAWSAGSPFGFARAALGLSVEDGVLRADPTAGIDATLYYRGQSHTVGSDETTDAKPAATSPGPDREYDNPEVTSDG